MLATMPLLSVADRVKVTDVWFVYCAPLLIDTVPAGAVVSQVTVNVALDVLPAELVAVTVMTLLPD